MRGTAVPEGSELARHTVMIRTPQGTCTGTLVAPDLVLTAAHCFLKEPGPEDVTVAFGPGGRAARTSLRAYALHDGFKGAGSSDDLALLLLRKGVPAGFGPVAPFAGRVRVGESVVVAGYGRDRAYEPTEGTLRQTTLEVREYDGREVGLRGPGGWGTCLGDSGGPTFVRRDGRLFLFSVISRGESESCRGIEAHALVSAYRSWIADTSKLLRNQL